ncbi:MAG TPA: serine/threonine-protein kinase [Nocardioides sp.]|nr:serine/threonine-protein kinase [Nocardioides sp.]
MIAGRYSLDREIGRGGTGAVWLGRDEVLGREVAIKRVGVAPGGSSPDLVRAEREARIAARVNHPHVVAVFDLVEHDDQQWLVMEYVEGHTLADLVRDHGPMTPDDAAAILSQAAEALSAAHAAGVVHRDVKPSNILVTAQGHVKLSDFGIARAEADANLTQTGMVTGSPAYLAPEVASGEQATPASDVWSLGATLFHTLSGHPPYDVGDNVLGALYRIVHEEPPRLDDAGWLTPLVTSSMTQDPAARWSMAEVSTFLHAGPGAAPVPTPVEPLQAVPPLAEEPDHPTEVMTPAPAAPPPPPERATVRRQRRRGGVLPWLVGVGVIALVVMLGLLVYYNNQDSPEPPASDEPTGRTTPSSDEPEPTTDPPGADAADLEQFAEDYVATAADDPPAGFAMLTSEYQQESGGLEGYETFWGTVTNPRILDVQADPDNLTVTYTYSYNVRGEGKRTETVTLRLVQDGDGFRIAGTA